MLREPQAHRCIPAPFIHSAALFPSCLPLCSIPPFASRATWRVRIFRPSGRGRAEASSAPPSRKRDHVRSATFFPLTCCASCMFPVRAWFVRRSAALCSVRGLLAARLLAGQARCPLVPCPRGAAHGQAKRGNSKRGAGERGEAGADPVCFFASHALLALSQPASRQPPSVLRVQCVRSALPPVRLVGRLFSEWRGGTAYSFEGFSSVTAPR
jgi:hypothetical protein